MNLYFCTVLTIRDTITDITGMHQLKAFLCAKDPTKNGVFIRGLLSLQWQTVDQVFSDLSNDRDSQLMA
jgi:hypothetical protein